MPAKWRALVSSRSPYPRDDGGRAVYRRASVTLTPPAVDKEGRTVDFLLLRAKRDVAARYQSLLPASAFRRQGRLPLKITLDGLSRPHIAQPEEALDELYPEGNQCKIRSSKYLNNLIEQDHRSVKLRLGPMLGLKHFRQAATTIAGIELMHRIRKGQFKLGRLGAKGNTAPKIWNAVLGSAAIHPTSDKGACLARAQTFAPQPAREPLLARCDNAHRRDGNFLRAILHTAALGAIFETSSRRLATGNPL